MRELSIVIKGAGEMASGIAHRLFTCRFTRILMSEIPEPLTVRRHVAFSEAVHAGEMVIEGVRAERIAELAAVRAVWERSAIALIVDGEAAFLTAFTPDILVDATMTKRPKSSLKGAGAPGFVIGVGPGFRSPDGVDAVIESNRGHDLGRVIYEGEAEPPTGVPGVISGLTKERVLRAPHAGMVRSGRAIGDVVKKGDIILYVDETPVLSETDGVLRGLIGPMRVRSMEKLGDVDPSGERRHCFTISEKARAIAGGVLEAVLHRFNG